MTNFKIKFRFFSLKKLLVFGQETTQILKNYTFKLIFFTHKIKTLKKFEFQGTLDKFVYPTVCVK